MAAETSKKIFTLRAVFGKQQGKCRIVPMRDYRGEMQGVDSISEEEKKKRTYFVDEKTYKDLEDGVTIDLNKERDMVDWGWVQHTPEVAASFDDAQQDPRALFYIDDPEGDAEKRVKERERRNTVMNKIGEASLAKKKAIARLLGSDMEGFTPLLVDENLSNFAFGKESELRKIEEAFRSYEQGNGKGLLYIYGLLDKRIVKRGRDGIEYDGRRLGSTEVAAFEYLQRAENADLMYELRRKFEGEAPKGDTAPADVVPQLPSEIQSNEEEFEPLEGEAPKAAAKPKGK